jgi:hypothetical protein
MQALNAITADRGVPVLVVVELVATQGGEGRERQVMQEILAAQEDGVAQLAAERSRHH